VSRTPSKNSGESVTVSNPLVPPPKDVTTPDNDVFERLELIQIIF